MTARSSPNVTITREDWQHAHYCEQCGNSLTSITVIRWAEPTPSQPERVAQQSHFFCTAHAKAAGRMGQQLVDTAPTRDHRLG